NLAKASIFTGDIGAMGYYSNAYIYDEWGLVTPMALTIDPPERMVPMYKPDYILLYLTHGQIELMGSSKLLETYTPIRRIDGSNNTNTAISLNPDDYPREWTHDYLLLQRKNILEEPSSHQ